MAKALGMSTNEWDVVENIMRNGARPQPNEPPQQASGRPVTASEFPGEMLASLRKAFPNVVFIDNVRELSEFVESKVKPESGHQETKEHKQTTPSEASASVYSDAKARGDAASCEVPAPTPVEYVSTEDVPPQSHDEIWAFALLSHDMLPPQVARHLFHPHITRFEEPMIMHFRFCNNERRACEDKLVDIRLNSLLAQNLDAKKFQDVLTPRHRNFEQCCYETASMSEFLLVDFMHTQLGMASLTAAVWDRIKARELMTKALNAEHRHPGCDESMRLLRTPSLGVAHDGMRCDRDEHGNIWSGPIGERYKRRGQLIAHLEKDLDIANDNIKRLLEKSATARTVSPYEVRIDSKEDFSHPELFRLHFQRARILEMKAIVHDQQQFSSPRSRPMPTRKLRRQQELEWIQHDVRIRSLFRAKKLPPRDASRTLAACTRDQVHVLSYLMRFLVPRYRLVLDYLQSAAFAAMPDNVIQATTARLAMCPGAPVDVVMAIHKIRIEKGEWKCSGIADTSEQSAVNGEHEEEWHIWDFQRTAFATDADFASYKTHVSKFLSRLVFYNRCIRKWFRLHSDLCAEFSSFPDMDKPNVIPPGAIQMTYFDIRCRWLLLGYLGSSENKIIKSLADKQMQTDKDALHHSMDSLTQLWKQRVPSCVRNVLPADLADCVSIAAPAAWGRTGLTRGHRMFTDFLRAHLLLQSSAEAKALQQSQAAAYLHLVNETTSPTWFARRRKREVDQKLPILATDALQHTHYVSLLDHLLVSGKARDKLMQTRLDLHANMLHKLAWRAVDLPALSSDKSGSLDIIRMLLDGLLFPVEGEWCMEHISPDLRGDFEKICLELTSINHTILYTARRFREHARQMRLAVQLDPVTIRYSMASVQLRLTMAGMRSKVLKELLHIPLMAAQYKDLQTVTLPFLHQQLKQHLAVWRDQDPEIKHVFSMNHGAGSSIAFNIDAHVFIRLVAYGM